MNFIKKILYSAACISGVFSLQATVLPHGVGADLYYGEESSCFINRWSFQRLCDHVFDPRTGKFDQPTTRARGGVTFNPSNVRMGDIIFVRRIDLFMQKMHPRISVPYIIVTHGDYLDTTQEGSLKYLDDEKIIAWFSIHPPKRWHEKYYPLPLGVAQRREIFSRRNSYIELFKKLRNEPKTKLLTGTFSLEDNEERVALAKQFAGKSYYSPSKQDLPFDRYLKELASSVFTLSPRGWGPDSYRTWEALLVGAIPIVKRGEYGVMECVKKNLKGSYSSYKSAIRSQLDRLYEHLPILVVDDWREVTKEFLEKKYAEITAKQYNIELLYIDYWKAAIKAVRKEYLKNYSRGFKELESKKNRDAYRREKRKSSSSNQRRHRRDTV